MFSLLKLKFGPSVTMLQVSWMTRGEMTNKRKRWDRGKEEKVHG